MKRAIILLVTLSASGWVLPAQSFAGNDSGITQKDVASATKTEKFVPIEWITIPGGKFMMGSGDKRLCYHVHTLENCPSQPAHEVSIKTFRMSRTVITVEQYAECVHAKKCTEPDIGFSTDYCNWGKQNRKRHPINCVNLDQAQEYAKFIGGRLPSEAEWEYAARSGGRNQDYPWGNEEPTPNRAVYGQPQGNTKPVCSKPAGNTEQSLCDMAGNIGQWVQDIWHESYKGAPVDGSTWDTGGNGHYVFRGSDWKTPPGYLLSAFRHLDRGSGGSGVALDFVGFRLAQSVP